MIKKHTEGMAMVKIIGSGNFIYRAWEMWGVPGVMKNIGGGTSVMGMVL